MQVVAVVLAAYVPAPHWTQIPPDSLYPTAQLEGGGGGGNGDGGGGGGVGDGGGGGGFTHCVLVPTELADPDTHATAVYPVGAEHVLQVATSVSADTVHVAVTYSPGCGCKQVLQFN